MAVPPLVSLLPLWASISHFSQNQAFETTQRGGPSGGQRLALSLSPRKGRSTTLSSATSRLCPGYTCSSHSLRLGVSLLHVATCS